MTIKAFIDEHPVLTYFALTFAISWGLVLLVVGGPAAIPTPDEEAMKLLGVAILMMVIGPSVAGILMTGLVSGRAGLRELRSRMGRWRVGARWHAVAVLAAPLLAMGALLALLPASTVFVPGFLEAENRLSFLLSGIAGGLMVGVLEELGWTGFAVPRLRARHGVLATGLIVGCVWGAWHVLVSLWGSGDPSGAFSMELFLPPLLFYVGVLPAYRVLMVWVYDNTKSLSVSMLMHASLTACVPMTVTPLDITWVPLMAWYTLLTAALWTVIAAVALAGGGSLSRQAAHRDDTSGNRPSEKDVENLTQAMVRGLQEGGATGRVGDQATQGPAGQGVDSAVPVRGSC